MKKIGILFGMENTFPQAFVDKVNSKKVKGIEAEFVSIDKVEQGKATDYAVIIDRISQDVPFYRAYLKNAAMCGTAVINNPFWWSADEKFFNNALAVCIDGIENISICCGSHNEDSSLYLTKLMADNHINVSDQRVYFAQLLGMSDHISMNLSSAGYNVAKYVPYGPVEDVIPYLVRRAAENTSIAGQTSRELALIKKEISRRQALTYSSS